MYCHGKTGIGSGAPCVYIILPPGLSLEKPDCLAVNITHSSFQVSSFSLILRTRVGKGIFIIRNAKVQGLLAHRTAIAAFIINNANIGKSLKIPFICDPEWFAIL